MFEAVKATPDPEFHQEAEEDKNQEVQKGLNGTRSEVSEMLEFKETQQAEEEKDALQELLPPDLYAQVLELSGNKPSVYNWFLQVTRSFEGVACIKLLVENSDVYGSDTLILEQLVIIASFKGSSMLRELLNASDAYGKDYMTFMKFVDVCCPKIRSYAGPLFS